ncbi:MAG: hypothetical protein KC766_13605 [Myxococcales bacterium]|nr:hypothetical protein [Myxococcales bacterium]
MRRWSTGLAAVVLLVACGDEGETDLFGSGGAGGAAGAGGVASGGSTAGGQASGGSSAGGNSSGGVAGLGGDANGGAGNSSSGGTSGASGGTTGGSSGNTVGGSASGGSASGGSASGGAATGGASGAATGGTGATASGGTGGGGTGGSAGTAAGGSGGSAAAGSGGTSTGGSGSGGTGGSGVTCGPPSGIGQPALYTTLDDDDAIQSPVYGNPVGVMYSGDGFRTAICQTGISISGSDRYVAYRQIKDGYQNFEYAQGTLSFWYQPSYDHDDGHNHHLFASSDGARWNSGGGLRIRKAGSSNANELQVLAMQPGPGPAALKETTVAAASYGWKKGDWVHVEVTWDFRLTSVSGQNVHIYLDGFEVSYAKTSSGGLSFPAESEDARFFIGAWGDLDSETASGLIDDFMIWTSVVR